MSYSTNDTIEILHIISNEIFPASNGASGIMIELCFMPVQAYSVNKFSSYARFYPKIALEGRLTSYSEPIQNSDTNAAIMCMYSFSTCNDFMFPFYQLSRNVNHM